MWLVLGRLGPAIKRPTFYKIYFQYMYIYPEKMKLKIGINAHDMVQNFRNISSYKNALNISGSKLFFKKTAF